jgi:putative membrane protein
MSAPRGDIGEEPDYRFSFANERTFLAWIRTALALLAGGLVVIQVLDFPIIRTVLGVGLGTLGTVLAAGGYVRWARAEEAMRLQRPLPDARLPQVAAIGVLALAVVGVAFFLIAGLGGL